MIAVELVVFRFPLPGEVRTMDWAAQVRKIGTDADGGVLLGPPDTLPPERLAEVDIQLASVMGEINAQLMARIGVADAALDIVRAERDAAREAGHRLKEELNSATKLAEQQAEHIAAIAAPARKRK